MKLASYRDGGSVKTGIVVGNQLIDTGLSQSMIELIADWPTLRARLEVAAAGPGIPLASANLCAPVPRPGKIFAIGLNYADHIAESKAETPKDQIWFAKASTSANGPHDPILISRTGPYVDYEAELVVVIGKGGKHIPADRAHEHVFGYCVGNDVTERAWQHRTHQWTLGKSFDTHAPFGPWITTCDEAIDPHTLDIRCLVNGEVRQTSNTQHLVFNIWDQIAHLSQAMTLEPGDVIFTGTPGGIGAAMNPLQFLKAGDVLRTEITGLGVIEATLEAEA